MAGSETVGRKKSPVEQDGEPLVAVGIPAFNEERTIGRVVLQAQRYVDRVIVCDDGSSDMTGDIAEGLGAEVIRHRENMGYGAALRSLFKRARELDADVLVTLDADGQHNPSEVEALCKPVLHGDVDVAIGSRFLRSEYERKMGSWYRRAGIKFITKMSNAASKSAVRDAQSGFRAYNRRAIKALSTLEDGMGASVEILLQAKKHKLRVREVAASCNYDGEKNSSNPLSHGASVLMSLLKLVVEERPLVFLGLPGIASLSSGAFFGVWMLRVYAAERRIITNLALASIAFVIIGFFFLSTAITLYAIKRVTKKVNQSRGKQ